MVDQILIFIGSTIERVEVLSGLIDEEVSKVLSNLTRLEIMRRVNLPFIKILFSVELRTEDRVLARFETVDELVSLVVSTGRGDLQVTRKFCAIVSSQRNVSAVVIIQRGVVFGVTQQISRHLTE